jgi:hypothetical protein
MRLSRLLTALLLTIAGSHAAAAGCKLIRYGYYDQHRPPFYYGDGTVEAKPPGASVDLAREAMRSADCPMQTVRLPSLRMVRMLELGEIDAAQIDALGQNTKNFAFPLDPSGNPDKAKALQLVTVVYVRARDKIAKDVNPATYFKGRKLGIMHGAPYAETLRKAGIDVDDGAQEAFRNLEKLARGRVDGFAGAMVSPNDLDAFIEKRFGKEIVRLDIPLRTAHLWLAFSKEYYASNRTQVDAMWNWYGSNGQRRLQDILKTYNAK